MRGTAEEAILKQQSHIAVFPTRQRTPTVGQPSKEKIYAAGKSDMCPPYETFLRPGWFRCGDAIKMGRPKNTQELLQLLQEYPKVKGAGVGHSW